MKKTEPKSRPKTKNTRKTKTPARKKTSGHPRDANFPIIGIGASAGGLEAFELFFKTMPAESGMAFVLVPHLDPGHASMLSDILQRNTTMPVHEAEDQTHIEPDHVYIIPPGKDMAIFHGVLNLSVPEQSRGLRLPIDSFFRSLAEDLGERAICIILSGSGSDGTLGLRAIHGAGGISFVQEPATAKYDGMPTSAVQSGMATYVLPVDKIPDQLIAYVRTIADTGVPPAPPAPTESSAIRRITMLLRSKTGNDFSQYKQSTIRRRIERRMAGHNIADIDTYARYLQEHPAEVHILFKELLINVTSFFRDPEAFDALRLKVLPRLFADKPENYTFRIWVPGCASGEEAYSLAMLFREFMEETRSEFRLQIYATDIDDDAITTARAGLYTTNIALDVPAGRLRRFFTKEETGFRIKKEIRETVVFAIQNVIKDPPFTKMDLISCRNLMIYLEPELQSRIIPAFHYALNPEGVLFLSPSEGIGNFVDLFSPLDKKWRIFSVKPSSVSTRTLVARRFPWSGEYPAKDPIEAAARKGTINFAELTRRVLLQSFAPPSVITDEAGNIHYVHGDTGKYLQPAQGQPSTSIIAMAREGLQMDLRLAIQNAAAQKKPFIIKDLQVKTNGGMHGVDLTVRPFPDPDATQELLLISFQDSPLPPAEQRRRSKRGTTKGEVQRVEELELALAYTKENLQATIEEMQAANEELQSTNEELQSTNEELETSKEELQSVNEEIATVNAVLEQRVNDRTEALSKANEALEEENAQRLEAEAKLQSSLDEKTMLLKEIHHRVKNNLQIIASLLNLQSRYIKDESTLAAIRESQNRVKAMALVHEKLYRSEDLAHIDLNEYIQFLGTGLFQFYGAKGRGIRFRLDMHDVDVDINTAIPLGLIINELISNSLKYAFPEGRQGEVAITIKQEEHTLTVLFHDDGVGIPESLDWRNTHSLGLQLVNTLTDQMDGTIELDRTAGTSFTMVLHEKK